MEAVVFFPGIPYRSMSIGTKKQKANGEAFVVGMLIQNKMADKTVKIS